MRYRKIRNLCLLGIALVSAGCAAESGFKKSSRASLDNDDATPQVASANPHGNFKVSVSSGGKPVANFQEKLVHRIVLSKQDLAALAPIPGRAAQVPFTGKVERDNDGGVVGLKLTEIRTNTVLPTLGLQDGDLLTAVGKKHVDDLSDLTQIAVDIQKHSEATLTLQRNGKPHKVFYTLK